MNRKSRQQRRRDKKLAAVQRAAATPRASYLQQPLGPILRAALDKSRPQPVIQRRLR